MWANIDTRVGLAVDEMQNKAEAQPVQLQLAAGAEAGV